jgi:glycosyltransferase involved in cell wall biosynthesis
VRIAIETQSSIGRKTGIGRYTGQLLAALRRFAPEHEYLELNWGRDFEMRTHRRLYWQQVELPRLAREAKADVLHIPGFDAPLRSPCPVVLSVHDLIGMLFPQSLPPVSRFYWRRWLPRSVRWSDRIIAVSEHTRRDLVRLMGIPAERIEVVYHGVDETFRPLDDRAVLEGVRRKYDLRPRIILYVGTLEPRKGLDTLIAAYHSLAADTPHELVIAGKKGWRTAPLSRQVRDLGLERRVRFTGYVPDEDLPWLYNLADLFVYPSRYEGFGLPPLEAMACGTPVICSNVASVPEVVGEAALMVQPDDAETLAGVMRGVLEDERRRTTMRARGIDRAKRFTWEATARRTVEIYEGLR